MGVWKFFFGVFKLARLKPVFAWTISAMLFAIIIAVFTSKQVWLEGILLNFALIFFIQMIASNGLNDLVDFESDKNSPGLGTGGSKVLLLKLFSFTQLFWLVFFSSLVSLLILFYYWLELGNTMLLLSFAAIWVAFGYNIWPLKLSWKPFAEWTAVLPANILPFVFTYFVATKGGFSLIVLFAAFIHAFITMSWYMVSRIPDTDADKAAGKKTTVVLLGRKIAKKLSFFYLFAGFAIEALAGFFFAPFFAGLLFFPLYLRNLLKLDAFDNVCSSKVRADCMNLTSVHTVFLGIVFGLVFLL